jgi:hypothetical protein
MNPWLVSLANRLLNEDPIADKLLAPDGNPFRSTSTVVRGYKGDDMESSSEQGKRILALKYVRAELYKVSCSKSERMEIVIAQ